MKLRLRSFESKETLKIEAPNPCTLSQLKQILSETLPNSPSPASIHLSLNRQDELQSDGEDSLGIAAGDLIYFFLEQPAVGGSWNSQSALATRTDDPTPEPCSKNSKSLISQNTLPEAKVSASVVLDSQKTKTIDRVSQMEETTDEMEVDDEDNESGYDTDGLSAEAVDKSLSVPSFLWKVFMEELKDNSGSDHKLIVIAVHAVMLESGFVGFDNNANVVVNGFQFRNEFPSDLFRVSLFYTLPGCFGGASGEAIKSVVLKFQTLGRFIYVYGTLGNGSEKRGTHWVQLNEDQLVPFLNVVGANCGLKENVNGKDGVFLGAYPEKELFDFWRTVKDNIAFPLLIDLCEEAGLELPPCFMQLSTDLKMKILEFLPGVDIAKLSCVCSELQYLGSNDDLWKLKFLEEFRNERKWPEWSWKKAFAFAWKPNNMEDISIGTTPYVCESLWRRHPNPFMVPRVPRMLGEERDFPFLPFGSYDLPSALRDSISFPLRNFLRNCDLGVRGGRFN